MAKNDREFTCMYDSGDSFVLDSADSAGVRVTFKSGNGRDKLRLGIGSSSRLIKQLQHLIDHGCLLPEEPPEPTSTTKEAARILLEVIGLEVDQDQIRVIQETKED